MVLLADGQMDAVGANVEPYTAQRWLGLAQRVVVLLAAVRSWLLWERQWSLPWQTLPSKLGG